MIDKEELSGIPLFAELSGVEREEIAAIIDKKKFSANSVIPGKSGSCGQLYIVKEGQVKLVRVIREHQEQTLGILKKGEFFGRVSFIDGQEHPAYVVSTTDSEILTLNKDDFNELARKDPMLAEKILIPLTTSLCAYLRMLTSKVKDLVEYVTSSKRPTQYQSG